jgi:hypothetical protein
MVPSPPPVHNFISEPTIQEYPYDFSKILGTKKPSIEQQETI